MHAWPAQMVLKKKGEKLELGGGVGGRMIVNFRGVCACVANMIKMLCVQVCGSQQEYYINIDEWTDRCGLAGAPQHLPSEVTAEYL